MKMTPPTAFTGQGPLNAAQVMVLAFVGDGPRVPGGPHAYKAPHAYRGAHPRPHFPRHLRKRPGLLKVLRP